MKSIRQIENLHVVVWLLKDVCWLLEWRLVGVLAIVPAMVIAILIAANTRHNRDQFVHNLAICCWIAANSTWMLGEFFFDDGIRPLALVFFVAGFSFIIPHYTRKIYTK